MSPFARLLASGIAGVGAGVALTLLLAGGSAREPAVASDAQSAPPALERLRGELAQARGELEQARGERDALAEQLAALEAELEGAREPAVAEEAEESGAAPSPVIDEAWLRERGFPEAEIERLRERWDRAELDRLYLTDLAKREGWQGSQRYRDRSQEIRDQLQEDLCDDGYDALLYATGRRNRVVVADVLGESPAARAGIERGDAILSYGGRRLFAVPDLLAATAAGRPGRSTELRIERGGQELRVFVPRGPLGVRVRRERRSPDTLRWPLACRGLG